MFWGLSDVCSVSYLKKCRKDAEVIFHNKRKQKKKTTSTEDKFKALNEIENIKPKSLVAAKYGVPRNTTSTWLLPANKEKIMAVFSSRTINLKRKNVKAGKYELLEKLFPSSLCLQDQATYQWVD